MAKEPSLVIPLQIGCASVQMTNVLIICPSCQSSVPETLNSSKAPVLLGSHQLQQK